MKSTIHDPSISELTKQFKKQNPKRMSKKILLIMAVAAVLFTSCNGKKTEAQGEDQTGGIHQHAAGEEHPNHEIDTVAQEEFTVGKDSVAPQEAHGHEHEDGEKHDH